MHDRWETIKVGIFVTLTLALLFGGYFYLKGFKWAKKKYFYKIRLTEASWINKGDPVTILGVPKGRIQDVQLYPDSVIVVIWLEDYKLRQGAQARVESQGIIGTMRISLTLGSGDTLPQWTTIPGYTQRDIGQVIADVGEFVARSDSLILLVSDILVSLKTILVGTESQLGELLARVKQSLQELDLTLREGRGALRAGQAQLDSTGQRLNTTLGHLDSLLVALRQGRGTMGRLVQDSTLYFRLDSTLQAVEDLLRDLKENPGRYVHISLF